MESASSETPPDCEGLRDPASFHSKCAQDWSASGRWFKPDALTSTVPAPHLASGQPGVAFWHHGWCQDQHRSLQSRPPSSKCQVPVGTTPGLEARSNGRRPRPGGASWLADVGACVRTVPASLDCPGSLLPLNEARPRQPWRSLVPRFIPWRGCLPYIHSG
jgi:hypothetical protein